MQRQSFYENEQSTQLKRIAPRAFRQHYKPRVGELFSPPTRCKK